MWIFIIGCLLILACTSESSIADVADNLRTKRQNHLSEIRYRPYNEAPDRIKEILQLQQNTEPLVHLTAAHAPLQLTSPTTGQGINDALPQPLQLESTQPQVFPLQNSQALNPQRNSDLAQHRKNQQFVYQQQRLQNQLAQISRPIQSQNNPQVVPQSQPTYKGLQALQAGLQQGPIPLRGQSLTPQITYTPQHTFAPQAQLPISNSINDVYKPVYPSTVDVSQYQAHQPSSQFSQNLPIHVQKIIEGYNRG